MTITRGRETGRKSVVVSRGTNGTDAMEEDQEDVAPGIPPHLENNVIWIRSSVSRSSGSSMVNKFIVRGAI